MVIHKSKRQINPQQALAVDNFCNPKSPTFGNQTQSYIGANYKCRGKTAMQAACRFFKRSNIKQAIEQYQPKTLAKRAEINREYAFNKWQELYDRCYKERDNTNCVALMRMVWQQQGLLDNKLVINLEDSRQLEEGHREAARRIAARLLSEDILDAEFEPRKLLSDNNVSDNDSTDNIIDSCE